MKLETEGLVLKELNISDGKLDMRLGGENANLFMVALINFFEQNGGKNFLTTTVEGKGKRYDITVTNLDGNDSPAEKIKRLESQNRELVKLLKKIKKYIEYDSNLSIEEIDSLIELQLEKSEGVE